MSSVSPLGLSLTSLTWGEQFHARFGSLQASCPMCMPGIFKFLPNTPETPQTQRGAHRAHTHTHTHRAWMRRGINTLRQTSTNGVRSPRINATTEAYSGRLAGHFSGSWQNQESTDHRGRLNSAPYICLSCLTLATPLCSFLRNTVGTHF